MADSAFNFCVNTGLNPNYDITWSFQYCLTGSSISTGGFCTFLFNNPNLIEGGRYQGLGYAPYQSDFGVVDSIIGIMFSSDNTIKIKDNNFNTIYSGSIFTKLSPLIKQTVDYNTIRFNLTNSGQILIISLKDSDNKYYEALKINTNLPLPEPTDFYKIGFSHASPLNEGEQKCTFKIKDIQVQGTVKIPVTNYKARPITKNYILQTPLSGKLNIAINNKSIGSIVY